MATEFTRGHLSAKLVVKCDKTNTETWLDYDTRVESEDPVEGTIMVFNSETGVYEPCTCLEHADQLFEYHNQRLTPVIPDSQVKLVEKRQAFKEKGKHLRNLAPFNLSPGDWS